MFIFLCQGIVSCSSGDEGSSSNSPISNNNEITDIGLDYAVIRTKPSFGTEVSSSEASNALLMAAESIGIQVGENSNLSNNDELFKAESTEQGYITVTVNRHLNPSTTYYYRTYVKMGGTYHYGEIRSFTTLSEDYLQIKASVTPQLNGAEVDVTYQKAVNVNTGVVYSTDKKNVESNIDCKWKESYGVNTIVIEELEADKTVYLRPYVTFSGGNTVWGDIIECTPININKYVQVKVSHYTTGYSQTSITVKSTLKELYPYKNIVYAYRYMDSSYNIRDVELDYDAKGDYYYGSVISSQSDESWYLQYQKEWAYLKEKADEGRADQSDLERLAELEAILNSSADEIPVDVYVKIDNREIILTKEL